MAARHLAAIKKMYAEYAERGLYDEADHTDLFGMSVTDAIIEAQDKE